MVNKYKFQEKFNYEWRVHFHLGRNLFPFGYETLSFFYKPSLFSHTDIKAMQISDLPEIWCIDMLNKWGKKTLLWNSENKNFAEYSKNIVPM
jgi:hypothetical protein